MTVTPLDAHEVAGKVIHRVYTGGWNKNPSGTRVPSNSKLFNFDLRVGDETYLVLDSYGDGDHGIQSEAMRERLLGPDVGNLAINKKTGVILTLHFYKESGKIVALLSEFPPWSDLSFRVPSAILPRLDELKSSKRPYYFTIDERTLLDFIDQEIGYRELSENILVSLDFRPQALEIGTKWYRYVGRWEETASV